MGRSSWHLLSVKPKSKEEFRDAYVLVCSTYPATRMYLSRQGEVGKALVTSQLSIAVYNTVRCPLLERGRRFRILFSFSPVFLNYIDSIAQQQVMAYVEELYIRFLQRLKSVTTHMPPKTFKTLFVGETWNRESRGSM